MAGSTGAPPKNAASVLGIAVSEFRSPRDDCGMIGGTLTEPLTWVRAVHYASMVQLVCVFAFLSFVAEQGILVDSEPHDPMQQARLPVVQCPECLQFPRWRHKGRNHLHHAFHESVHQFERNRVNRGGLPADAQ